MSFSLTNWLKSLKPNFIGTPRHHPRSAARPLRTTRLSVEVLEDRVTPAATITSLASLDAATGYYTAAGLVMDASGNLFGTAQFGGASNQGTLFEIVAGSGTIKPLASFGGFIGAYPTTSLVMDGSGNLFGTALECGAFNYGTVFEVAAGSGTVTPLAFFNGANGAYPTISLVMDGSGNLFGGTQAGGGGTYGSVFEIAAGSGVITTLASFNGANGAYPAGLVLDGGGNLFGTTLNGGASGDGTVFEVAAGSGAFTTLASFNGANGATPVAPVLDGKGNLFGTTYGGGASGLGTVFEVATGSGAITTLATFNGPNGASPDSGVVMDGGGNLFGTTLYTILGNNTGTGFGTVFEVAAGSGAVTTLASFNGDNGAQPAGPLVMDGSGNLFGTTIYGGASNQGTVFEFAGAGTPALLPTVLTLTAANATYTGAPYDTANLTATVMPAAASGSVSYVFYSDAGGQNAIADPTNAGTYYVQAVFTSSDPARFTNATSGIVPFTITAKSLSVDATTQGTINIAKAGTISFALQITAGLVAGNDDVAALFNGATFTITVGGTSYSLTSTATVANDGTINVSMKMSQGLQDALLTALSEGSTVDFSLSALSNDGDYSVDADAISRLISQGKLKYAVV